MRLLVLRHGVAVDASQVGGDDAARYLTAEGRRGVQALARAMRAWDFAPEAIWSSAWKRAWETALIAAKELKDAPAIEREPALEGPHDLAPLLARLAKESARKSLLIVGHNPSLTLLAGLLIAPATAAAESMPASVPNSSAGLHGASLKLKKGGLAVIDFSGEVGPGRGVLRGLHTPDEVMALVRD